MSVRIGTSASPDMSAHFAAAERKYDKRLEDGIAKIRSMAIQGGRTGAGHESTDSVAKRIVEEGHVFCLLEKCLIRSSNFLEGIDLFSTEMKAALKEAWRSHYANPADLDSKVDKVVAKLVATQSQRADWLSRRVQGYKDARAMASSGSIARRCDGYERNCEVASKRLCDRLMSVARHRSDGASAETSRLVQIALSLYSPEENKMGSPFFQIWDQHCKAHLTAANPRDVVFDLAGQLAERLHNEKGYTVEDATRKAFHIVQRIVDGSKAEIAAHFSYMEGFLQSLGLSRRFIETQKGLLFAPDHARLMEASTPSDELLAGYKGNVRATLSQGAQLMERYGVAFDRVAEGESTKNLLKRFDDSMTRDTISLCLASAPTLPTEYDRTAVLAAISAGFTARLVDMPNTLKDKVKPRASSAEEKMGKLRDAFAADIVAKLPDSELRSLYQQMRPLRGYVARALEPTQQQQIERYKFDRALEAHDAHESAWQQFGEVIDRVLQKKAGSEAYLSSHETLEVAQRGGFPMESLVQRFYALNGKSDPAAFRLEFVSRMQRILRHKDEQYYFISNPDKAREKIDDLYKDFMTRLGVTDLRVLETPTFSFVGRGKEVSNFENIRREAVAARSMFDVDQAVHASYVKYCHALRENTRDTGDERRMSSASTAGSDRAAHFNPVVLGEYGAQQPADDMGSRATFRAEDSTRTLPVMPEPTPVSVAHPSLAGHVTPRASPRAIEIPSSPRSVATESVSVAESGRSSPKGLPKDVGPTPSPAPIVEERGAPPPTDGTLSSIPPEVASNMANRKALFDGIRGRPALKRVDPAEAEAKRKADIEAAKIAANPVLGALRARRGAIEGRKPGAEDKGTSSASSWTSSSDR